MHDAAAGSEAALRRLRQEIFNLPPWEELILFTCERLSRMDLAGAEIVAAAVLQALPIDPMLAAEMVFRSSPEVWEQVRDGITRFAARWHTPGRVDRAIRFMITSGRPEFADFIWPLIANPDFQDSHSSTPGRAALSAISSGHRCRQ